MSTPLEIFDRKSILAALSGSCLSGTHTNAIIVNANKVGKSHLLGHVYSLPRTRDLLACRVDLDTVRAAMTGVGATADDAFLRQLLEQIGEHVRELIAEGAEEEPKWTAGISAADAVLANPASTPAERQAHDDNRRAFATRITNLAKLRGIAQVIEPVQAQPEPLVVANVLKIFNRLYALGYRVLLVVDEFHRALREVGLSDTLYNFLRGANNEGKLVALVSSTINLMDQSLHVDANPVYDRRALFNHFQLHALPPFNADEAGGFLDFIKPEAQFTADEKAYLIDLGGGSPHFLKRAADEFLREGRPPAGGRPDFERLTLVPVFEPGFTDLWNRATPAEREILQSVARGRPVPRDLSTARLERDGYLVVGPGATRLFSRPFSEFVLRQTDWIGGNATVTVDVVTPTVPVSMFYADPRTRQALVSFSVRNPTDARVRAVVSCEVQGYVKEQSDTIDVDPRDEGRKDLSVTFPSSAVRNLEMPENVSITCSARMIMPQAAELLAKNLVAQVMPVDYFVFARVDAASGMLADWTWMIAAWVNRLAAELAPVVARAKANGAAGYAPPPAMDTADTTWAQIRTLWEELRRERVVYDNTALVYHQPQNDYVQRVRRPGTSLREKAANCLDGCVLFASLLDACGYDPLIVFLPGHALVGWRTAASATAGWEVIDTTVGDVPFQQAHDVGERQHHSVKPLLQAWYRQRPTHIDPRSPFAIPVDVHDVIRTRQLVPLP